MTVRTMADNYPSCINRCYIPTAAFVTAEDAFNEFPLVETYKDKIFGNKDYYKLNPCMLRLKFAQHAVTDWVVQPIMTIAMMIGELYTAVKFLFNCFPDEMSLKERVQFSGLAFLHVLSLPFLMGVPALLAAYSIFDLQNGRHYYCMIERYMYSVMGFSGSLDIESTCKPFLAHRAKPFAPDEIVNAYQSHLTSLQA